MPNQPGIYGVVYSDKKINHDHVFDYAQQYEFYKPNKVRIRTSQDIKVQFLGETNDDPEVKAVVESLSKVMPFAYLVCSEICELSLLSEIRESLIVFCRKAVNSGLFFDLQREKQQEREDTLTCRYRDPRLPDLGQYSGNTWFDYELALLQIGELPEDRVEELSNLWGNEET